ncbi:HEAT repeat domain-containing protein [Singulisphaera sp. PoT]|uniref:HEAT repeat domain-containing protein n=1 Tax=Singulisphaera sp. PoT TaxID=3411797 RepID=UPI003BF50874
MLEGLDDVPWADLEHGYGAADDVPDFLRQLLDPDPTTRAEAFEALHVRVFHQGTRYQATPYVVPFLLEMCSDPSSPDRGTLLGFWGSLITGYFSIQERPFWGDGERLHATDHILEMQQPEDHTIALHRIYRESLAGHGLACDLLDDDEPNVRANAAWLLACLPTMAEASIPGLEARLNVEPSGAVRAAIAFALGELGAADALRRILDEDEAAEARCVAACELARIGPTASLIDPLLEFLAEPIDGYESIPGVGGKSTGDAAFAISLLPGEARRWAIPAICDRLDQARSFDTMPLVQALLATAFTPRDEALTELTALQREVLVRMVNTEELWMIGNLTWAFRAYGLPHRREACARLVGIKVANDPALAELRTALAYAEIGFLGKAREGIDRALEADPIVFERSPSPDECWLLCAKAFAETDPERALEAYRLAISINPAVAHHIHRTWRLADLLDAEES